jgi:hypothetical protein
VKRVDWQETVLVAGVLAGMMLIVAPLSLSLSSTMQLVLMGVGLVCVVLALFGLGVVVIWREFVLFAFLLGGPMLIMVGLGVGRMLGLGLGIVGLLCFALALLGLEIFATPREMLKFLLEVVDLVVDFFS